MTDVSWPATRLATMYINGNERLALVTRCGWRYPERGTQVPSSATAFECWRADKPDANSFPTLNGIKPFN